MLACKVEAGTWSAQPFKDDDSLPHPSPESVTHAIAFGIDKEPPAPAPFEITGKISGENWAVLRYPEQSASVVVTRRTEELAKRPNATDAEKTLLRGRIIPKGNEGGLSLELSGLEPGRKYRLALFGVAIVARASMGRNLVSASASDASDEMEVLDKNGKGSRFFVYEYTAPADGMLTVSIGNSDPVETPGVLRMCAFLNYRIE